MSSHSTNVHFSILLFYANCMHIFLLFYCRKVEKDTFVADGEQHLAISQNIQNDKKELMVHSSFRC